MDIQALHAATLEATSGVVDRVRPEDLSKATPCSEWDVRTLVGHLVGVNRHFAQAANGETVPFDPMAPPPDPGADPASAYRESAREAIEAWSRPGVLDGMVRPGFAEIPGRFAISIHLTDNLVHRWDLARALGEDPAIDPEAAAVALETVQTSLTDAARGPGKPFGARIEWPDDAPLTERLIAFLGRHPGGG